MFSGNSVKYNLSKELMGIKAQEKLMFQIKDFDRAEELRQYGDLMEQIER